MKRNNLHVGLMVFAILLAGVSCSDEDNTPSYSTGAVQNTELKTILIQRGYTFNENGNLLLDDLANNTTTLDLSGTQISTDALAALSMFPNLTDVDLSDNGYGPIIDLSLLPKQITGIDLRGNKIYDFDGLVNASVVNDEVQTTILHNFTKLYLPETAKWNVEDLMPFYTKNQANGTNVDMQMVDKDGNLQVYNTLREIPDKAFRDYLKSLYSSLFPNDGTQIDISRPMQISEGGSPIDLYWGNANIVSAEGIEYFINNPYYKDFAVSITMMTETPYSVGYLMPGANIKGLVLVNINTPEGINLSKASKLAYIGFVGNQSLTSLDLSNTLFMQQNIEDFDQTYMNAFMCISCKSLTQVKLPSNNKGLTVLLQLTDLPALESVDLSSLVGVQNLALLNLPKCSIIYPKNLQYAVNAAYKKSDAFTEGGQVELAVSQDILDMDETVSFIKKYRDYLTDGFISYSDYGAIRWSKKIK